MERRVRAWVKAASRSDWKDDEDREEDDQDEDRHSKDAITSRRAVAVVVVVDAIVRGCTRRGPLCEWHDWMRRCLSVAVGS